MSPAQDADRIAEAVATIVSAWPVLTEAQINVLQRTFAPVPKSDRLSASVSAALRARRETRDDG